MSGITSPARPWFKLSTQGFDTSQQSPVKLWLDGVSKRMTSRFLRSNLYNVLPVVYGDLGTFGTAAMLVEKDPDTVFRFSSLPIGSYMISSSNGFSIDIVVREFKMTIRQIVEKFAEYKGEGKYDFGDISESVINQWNNNQRDVWIEICHIIKPNPNWNPNKESNKFKRYTSMYYEKGSTSTSSGENLRMDDDQILRESGFDFFPVLVPRWEVSGEDFYGGNCPGMVAIGDIKQLQLGEKRSAQAIEKMIYPPMVGSTRLRNQSTSILPGDITFVDETSAGAGFGPAHETRFSLTELENKQQQIRRRISRSFYEDLFLMLANTDRREITAREIDEKKEEKLLALGPVLEQLNQDLLDPLIDIAFAFMNEAGEIPEPPEELQGQDLKVEYVSIMAQAQKLVGLGGIERFIGFAGNLLDVYPEIKDKIDMNNLIDNYADLTSVPTGIVKSKKAVEEEQAIRQAEQQKQQQLMEAEQQAKIAKDLAASPTDGSNALNGLIQQAEAGALV